MLKRTLTHFHLCCGLGSGAAGFSDSKPVLGPVQAEWRCLGGVDVDPAGLRDFQMMTGVPGTLMDLFTPGETFMLSNVSIWVQPVAIALSVAQQEVGA